MLEISAVDAGYGSLGILWGVSLAVRRGEIVALIGSNGAGKTTLLKTVAGLLIPTAGSITLHGNELSGMSPHLIAGLGIALVPEGRKVFATMSVEENLLMGAYLKANRPWRGEGLKQVYELFPRLQERRQQAAATLSGGEQQMLAIGRALMMKPDLLLLDEPSLGLAPLLIHSIYDCLLELNRKGLTILLVEQNVKKALAISQRAYLLENGAIVLQGESAAVAQDTRVVSAYLA